MTKTGKLTKADEYKVGALYEWDYKGRIQSFWRCERFSPREHAVRMKPIACCDGTPCYSQETLSFSLYGFAKFREVPAVYDPRKKK